LKIEKDHTQFRTVLCFPTFLKVGKQKKQKPLETKVGDNIFRATLRFFKNVSRSIFYSLIGPGKPGRCDKN